MVMEHIKMGLKFVCYAILGLICLITLLSAIGMIAILCGDVVAYGVCIALILFALGVVHSYDGG